jgi:hypothetical protein
VRLLPRSSARVSDAVSRVAGAFVDVADKEGFTPLHMAAGYLHNEVCTALLAGGADISKKDRQGRDISALLDSLREKMTSASAIKQRMRLEEVNKALTYFTYEDVAPAAVLASRKVEGQKQYLVQWRDDSEDSWVAEEFVSAEVCLSDTAPVHACMYACLFCHPCGLVHCCMELVCDVMHLTGTVTHHTARQPFLLTTCSSQHPSRSMHAGTVTVCPQRIMCAAFSVFALCGCGGCSLAAAVHDQGARCHQCQTVEGAQGALSEG